MPTTRVYLAPNAAGVRWPVRYLLLDGLLAKDIPAPEPGQTTVDLTRLPPDETAETWDPTANAGAGGLVPIPVAPPASVGMSKSAWLERFTDAEQVRFARLRRGLDPVTRVALSADAADDVALLFVKFDAMTVVYPRVAGNPNPRLNAFLTKLNTYGVLDTPVLARRTVLLSAVGAVASDTEP